LIGVLVISHGNFASGLLNAAEMIMGTQEQIKTAGLQPEEGPESFRETLEELVQEVDDGEGVLVLADLMGGSPANAGAYLLNQDIKVDLVTGVNLPMLLEVLTVRGGQDLESIANLCVSSVSEGVKKFSDVFSGQN